MTRTKKARQPLTACRGLLAGTASLLLLAGGHAAAQTSLYPPGHMCAQSSNQTMPVCQVLNEAMTVPADNNAARPVFQPHRGVWGEPAFGASENTISAMLAAHADGYRIIELDFMFADTEFKSGKTYPDGDQIAMSHYFDMFAFGGTSGVQPRQVKFPDLSEFRQRKRDMTISADPLDHVASFREALQLAKERGLIIGVDVKTDGAAIQQPVGSAPTGQEQDFEYAALIAGILHEAKAQNALGYLVVKSDRTLDHIIKIMATQKLMDGTTNGWDYYFSNFAGKFLWAPIINKKVSHSQTRTIGRLVTLYAPLCKTNSGATRQCVEPKEIFSVEVQIFNLLHWTANTITIAGNSYDNLLEAIIGYTGGKGPARRPSTTIIEPMGPLGTFGRVYNWKFIGNDIDADDETLPEEDGVGGVHIGNPALDDLRSDPTFLFGLPHARRTIIMTDRPDVYDPTQGGMLK